MLKLLGTPSIEGPDGPVTGRAAQGRRVALLALLALGRGRPVTRDRIIAMLWPESGSDRARPQLSDTLYILRSGLGDVVRAAGDDLALNPEAICCDVSMFEKRLDEGRLDSAIELFVGPLLDGFHLSGAVEFERWLDGERARIGQRYAAAVESLADASEAGGQFTAAVGWWRRLVSHDPYSGRVALRLMRALQAIGDRAGALQHARSHGALLHDEFDARPDPEVEGFAERLRHEPPVRPPPEPAAVRPAPGSARSDPASPAREAPAAYVAPPARQRPAANRRLLYGTAATLLVVLAIIGVYGIRGVISSPRPPTARSVGVLPFVNMSADPENVYFSDGLSEQVIGALSRIDGLSVAARTSSFALRDRTLDVRMIGDTLSVETVLEGSVQRDGQRLRVSAQLIDAATGYHIWSEEYDRELADVFAMQEEIARAIAAALELRLTGRAVAAGQTTPDLAAYDLYLRGIYLRNSLSADGLRQAVEYFDRAIELEPEFALAYAAKASVIAPLIYFRHVPLEQGVADLRALTARALELDPALGEAYAALGILELFFDWDWDAAEQALRRAIALNPSDPHAHHHLANYMQAMGRPAEALAARRRSVELDPLNARTLVTLGNDYVLAGDLDGALASYRRALKIDPVSPLVLGLGPGMPRGPAEVYLRQGREAEAVEEYLRIAELRGASVREVEAMRGAHASSGLPGFWRAWLDMDIRQSGGSPDPLRAAANWALIGDSERALSLLERAYAERNPGLIYLRSDPAFDRIRSHPRFARILTEMKLPAG